MLAFIRKHPIGVGSGAVVAVLGLAWLAFGYFGVHTLFVDDVVDEAGPTFDTPPAAAAAPAEADTSTATVQAEATAAAPATDTPTEAPEPAAPDQTTASEPTTTTAPPPTTTPAEPQILTEYEGVFESDAHPTAGNAVVLGNGTGQRFLRFENFETDNGPDLNVYLVNSSTGDVSDYIDLGDLKGNIGDQNYEIPADVDLDVYDQVVIWCVRFSVGFGDAQLAAV